MDSNRGLPQDVASKLRRIRRRAIITTLFRGLLLSLALVFGAVLAALMLDWLIGWIHPASRYLSTTLAAAMAAIAFIIWCVRPLLRRQELVSTARQVDDSMPELEERWSTVTELAHNQDTPEIRGSDALIRQVASESQSVSTTVSPAAIVPATPILRASRWFAAAAGALAVFFVLNHSHGLVLLERFLLPGKDISLTKVTAAPGDGWVPKGEPLTLKATLQGRIPPRPATVLLRGADGEHAYSMSRSTGAPPSFLYSLAEVSDSFEYRVRSGDGQTPWHRITSVDRPTITAVQLKIRPPAYSGLTNEDQTSLPQAIRVLQGSEVEVAFQSDQPLDRMILDLGNGESVQLSADADQWYRYRSRPTNSYAFAAAAINQYQLESKSRPSCRVSVYEDRAPTVTLLEPSDDVAVAPDAKVNVTFEATDDFAITKAEMVLNITKADGATNEVTVPIDLGKDAGKKELQRTVHLDPRALGLRHGDQLSYVVQVTDSRQSPAQAGADSRTAQAQQQGQQQQQSQQQHAEPGSPTQVASATDSSTQANGESSSRAEEKEPQVASNSGEEQDDPADPRAEEPNDSESNPATASNSQNSSQDSKNGKGASKLANNAQKNQSDEKRASGDSPPPDEMTRRALDVGQSSACKPRNISVDEWAGQFDGEKRQKLEIAIEPVLKRLGELLLSAQENTEKTRAGMDPTTGLKSQHEAGMVSAREHLAEGHRVVAELQSTTAGTPYAFIGLQLGNIDSAHVTPAHQLLGEITIGTTEAPEQIRIFDKTSFHIEQAREMLAALNRSYETIKRDQQLADSMQKLSKMYQIFLEDTQALLGGPPGPINSYDRKIAEVQEEYVEKLKALLEEKKEIMAELARVLSEDPRLLRRYLAMLQQSNTSYRDQLTVLAEDQKRLKEQVDLWNNTPEAARPELVSSLKTAYKGRWPQIARDARQLRENMETWLPLDIEPGNEQIKAALTRSEKIAQLTTQSAGPQGSTAAAAALEDLRALRESLLKFGDLPSTNQARMGAYVANRLTEIESLITAHSGQMKITGSLESGDFASVAEIVQQRLTERTVALEEKIDLVRAQVATMSSEISEKADLLTKTLQEEIITPQQTSLGDLARSDVATAGNTLRNINPAFASAETIFDELMRLVIAKLDEAPPPDAPGANQDLESLLALLQEEMKSAENLGIPCRPVNISIMRDWMRPNQNSGSQPGQGQGRAQARAAQAQAQKSKEKADQIQNEARKSAKEAMAQARQENVEEVTTETGPAQREAWNKLASKLQKDVLQGRDNTPPEQYRDAIHNYFRILSDTKGASTK